MVDWWFIDHQIRCWWVMNGEFILNKRVKKLINHLVNRLANSWLISWLVSCCELIVMVNGRCMIRAHAALLWPKNLSDHWLIMVTFDG